MRLSFILILFFQCSVSFGQEQYWPSVLIDAVEELKTHITPEKYAIKGCLDQLKKTEPTYFEISEKITKVNDGYECKAKLFL